MKKTSNDLQRKDAKNSVLEFENLLSSSSVEDKNFIVSELELASLQLECLKQELVCLFVTLNAEIQNIVVEVVMTGYMYKDRVLRCASVKVSKKSEENNNKGDN